MPPTLNLNHSELDPSSLKLSTGKEASHFIKTGIAEQLKVMRSGMEPQELYLLHVLSPGPDAHTCHGSSAVSSACSSTVRILELQMKSEDLLLPQKELWTLGKLYLKTINETKDDFIQTGCLCTCTIKIDATPAPKCLPPCRAPNAKAHTSVKL